MIEGTNLTPELPEQWEHVIGLLPIDLGDELIPFDEDIFAARNTGFEYGEKDNDEMWIVVDGGKKVSRWHVELVIWWDVKDFSEKNEEVLMADWLDTDEELDAWLRRAGELGVRMGLKEG